MNRRKAKELYHPALVISGMHRSGTSLVASLFQSSGLNIGQRLMGAGPGNPVGHFEDMDFVEFHMRTLQANGCHSDGFTVAAGFEVPVSQEQQALAIVASRRLMRSAWGWKDPRTILFLDFWERLLPEAKFLFLVRSPWEVIDSLFRRNDVEAVQLNPTMALLTYERYYSAMKDFVGRHTERCVVFDIADVFKNAQRLINTAQEHLGLRLGEPQPLIRPDLFKRMDRTAKEAVLKICAPRCIELYEEVRALTLNGVRRQRRVPARARARGATPSAQLPFILEDWSREHDVKRELAQYRDGMHQALHAKAEMDAALGEARMAVERQAVEVAEQRTQATELMHKLARCEGRINDLSARCSAATAEAELASERSASMEKVLAERDAAIADLSARCSAATAEAELASERSASMEKLLAERDAAIADLSARCSAAAAETNAAAVRLASMEAALAEPDQRGADVNGHQEIGKGDRARKVVSSNLLHLQQSTEPGEACAPASSGNTRRQANGAGGPHASRRVAGLHDAHGTESVASRLDARCMAVTLTPFNDIALRAVVGENTSWAMTGRDPAFLLKVDGLESVPPGHYELLIDSPGDSQRNGRSYTAPKLYFDCGTGFRETDSVRIAMRPFGRYLRGRFVLPVSARQIRFDPSVRPGHITTGAVSLRRLSRTHYYATTVSHLVKDRLRRGSLVPALRRATQVWQSHGIRGLAAAVRLSEAVSQVADSDYTTWRSFYEECTAEDIAKIRSLTTAITDRPVISVIMPTFNTKPDMLREAIESVLTQAYDRWELCIADDCSTKHETRAVLQEYSARDDRIKVVFRSKNGHIAEASNTALGLATGEWVCFLDHDDKLTPDALYCVADAIRHHPTKQVFYSDEDKLDATGRPCDPYFKSDWNPDLFLSHNLITHLAVYRRRLVNDVGGLRRGFDGAQDYDLALRIVERVGVQDIHHIPHVLYHWRVHAESTAAAGDAKPYAMLAGERALQEHLDRRGVAARAVLKGFGYQVAYDYPPSAPLASIIIPTRNAHALTRRCIESIRTKTEIARFELLLVDNGSDDPESCRYFESLQKAGIARVVRDPRPFNYSALNNLGVRHAQGDVLVLLNNDIEVITPTWLRTLVSIAVQPGVGAVGAKLLYPDGTLQHGGVILGLGGLAAHAHTGFPRSSAGYVGRAALQQSFSAVTGACLAVRRDTYLAVGGLDERELPVAYNDVDFCLKLVRHGLRNVWTPYAELYHHESATRGYETTPEKRARQEREMEVIRRRWQSYLDHDPAYSPNLTDSASDFSLAWPPRVQRPWC